jgi:hypothetical protein
MRSARPRRSGFLDMRRITLGDYVVLGAALLMLISLFLPWFSVPGVTGDKWAFAHSEIAAVIVIIFFLASVFLVIYPSISSEMGLPPLPFSTPVVFLIMGAILLLIFTYELGKYSSVEGFGVWLALLAAIIYIVGAVVKWGSRPSRGVYGERAM